MDTSHKEHPVPNQKNRAHQQLERMTFFADAVFAIAMTLLVIGSPVISWLIKHEWRPAPAAPAT